MQAFDESEGTNNIEPEENQAVFEQLPPASRFPGKKIKDDEGHVFKSNGVTWEPI